MLSRIIFGFIEWAAARNGLAGKVPLADVVQPNLQQSKIDRSIEQQPSKKQKGIVRRRTGVRGETFAYWYLRRYGYTIVARNFTATGCKGEIDLIGYDGGVLVSVEVKTRKGKRAVEGVPEDAVTADKRHHLSRMARQFVAQRHVRDAVCRFDVVAIESCPGARPTVRLHKGAFAER